MKLSAILTACLASFAIAEVAVSSTDAAISAFKSPTICDPSVKQVSGYIDAASDRHYFFWLKLHIFGESFAAHFVTASAHAMRNRPQLESIGIGSGLIDPYHHVESYAKMACNSTYGQVLPTEQCQQLDHIFQTECKPTIARCYQTLAKDDCNAALNRCLVPQLELYFRSGLNSYDVRIKCEEGYLCYPVYKTIEKYFNKPDVQAALGVNQTFQMVNLDIYMGYRQSGDWMSPAYLRLIPGLLRKGIRVLVYAGDADFVCTWYGAKAWMKDLDWYNKPVFNAAPDRAWSVDGKPAGEVRSAGPLTFARVFGAGHAPSYDQPRPIQALTNRWLSNQPIA
ncbi:alpha/beta-hydrolase [Ramicandelaber brevisporus]|nr:alpha/beta-hydrolase [Ramicandelaber brevisporus]